MVSDFRTTFAFLQPLPPRILTAAPIKPSSCSKCFFPFLENSIPRKLPPDCGGILFSVLRCACQSARIPQHHAVLLGCHQIIQNFPEELEEPFPRRPVLQQRASAKGAGLGSQDSPQPSSDTATKWLLPLSLNFHLCEMGVAPVTLRAPLTQAL